MFGLRLSTRITIAAITLVVTGAMALMFIEEARLRDVYLSEQRTGLEKKLNAEKLRLSHAINTLRQDVLFLSNNPPIPGIVRAMLNRGYDARDGDTRERWEARLQQVFSAFLIAHPSYFQVRYIGVDDGGRELVRVDNRAGKTEITPPSRLQAKSDRDYFKATLGLHPGEIYLTEFNLNQEWGVIEQPHRPTLSASTPVFTPSGQIHGMVVINMDTDYLLMSAASNLPAGVLTYMTTMNGEYLLHPDTRRSFGFELGSKDNITSDFPFLEKMFKPQASEQLPLQAVATKAGTQYLAAERIHFDPGNPARFMMLTYRIPDTVVAQQIAGIPARHIIGGFIAMLLVSGIAFLVLRRTFAPLEQLMVAAGKIAAGIHDVQLPQNSSGEIGSLANAFGVMQANLSQREHDIRWVNAWLEDRVKERTAELEKAQQKTQKLLHEISAQQIELEMQNDELRRAQNTIEESRDRYADLYDLAPIGYLTLTREAFISEINLTGAALLMKERTELIHSRFAHFITPVDSDRWHRHFMHTLQHGDKQSCELMLQRDNDTSFHAQLDCLRLINDGDTTTVRIVLTDITVRKQAEAQQAKSMSLLQATLESTNDAILVVDLKNTWVLHNQRFIDLWHITDEIIAAKDDSAALLYVLNQLEDADGFLNKVRELYATPEANSYDIIKFKDGRIIERSSIPQFIGGNVVGRVWSFRNITERKKSEDELRISAAAFETKDAIMVTDVDGNIIRVNQSFSDITGYSREEVLGKNQNIMKTGQCDDISCIEMLQQSIRDELWTGEIWDKRKNGQIYPKWMTSTAIRNDQQEIIRYVTIFSDITARKQIEKENLRESDDRFRGTLEQAAVGIAHATLDGQFRQINQKFCKITGYPRDELIQMGYRDITFPADKDENDCYIQQLLAGKISTFSMEKRYVRKDGSLIWCNLTVSLLRDADGIPKYTIGVIEDIAERKHAELLAQQFGHLLQSSFNEIYLLDAHNLHFLLASDGAERNLGYTFDELNQLTLLDLIPSLNREGFEQLVAPLRSGVQPLLAFETALIRKNGTAYPVDMRLQLMEPDRPIFVAIAQDITERQRADMELNQSRQLLRDLAAQTEAFREEERKCLAREVHDELGQILTALRMNISLLRIEFGGSDAALLERIERITGLLDQSIQCTRDVVNNLRPATLDMGIVPAVKWLCDEFIKHTGTSCVVYLPEEEIHLDELLAVAAFRVVQESLTNVTRYAEASKVEIIIKQDTGNFSVTVNDNGKGFDYMAIPNHKSFGLLGMRERAIALGGVVNIYSAPQHGTQVFFTVPNTRIIDNNTEERQP